MELSETGARRQSNFPEKLARHGFYKNNTLTEATVSRARTKTRDKKRILVVSQAFNNINLDLKYISKLQGRIGRMQSTLDYELCLRNSALKVQSW